MQKDDPYKVLRRRNLTSYLQGGEPTSYPSAPTVSDPSELEYSGGPGTSGNYSGYTSEQGAISGLRKVLFCGQGL